MKMIGLDAGPNRFVLAEGTTAGRDVQLYKLFSVDIPTGSVADGTISDHASVRSALEANIKVNKVRTKSMIVAVNSNAMVFRRLEVPAAKDRDMNNLVTLEMNQFLPTGKRFIVDYVTIDEVTSASGNKMHRVKAAALPAELCEGYFKLVQDIGLKARQLVIQQQVMGRLFAKDASINGKAVGKQSIIAVDMASFQNTLHVIMEGEVDLSRTLPVGSANMERMVADRMQTSPEEARTYIRKTMEIHHEQSDAADTARRFLMQITQEIRKVQQYIRTKNSMETIRVYLYGIGSGLNGMDSFLAENLETEVETVKTHSRIKMPPSDRTAQLGHYLNAAGALLKA